MRETDLLWKWNGRMQYMTDILWWIQLADCTTFEEWERMRDILIRFPLPEGAVLGYSWAGEIPEAISIIGGKLPMELDELLLQWKSHLRNNEYIVMVEMQRTDVLRRHAAKWYVMTVDDYVEVNGLDAARYLLTSVTDWDGIS